MIVAQLGETKFHNYVESWETDDWWHQTWEKTWAMIGHVSSIDLRLRRLERLFGDWAVVRCTPEYSPFKGKGFVFASTLKVR
jgi:hypothetical protein